jgi:hypothetical protein
MSAMCNLYSMTKNQDAIRNLFKVNRDTTGSMPTLPGIFPDMLGPATRRLPFIVSALSFDVLAVGAVAMIELGRRTTP